AQTVAVVAAVLTAPLVLAWIERGRPGRLSAFAPLCGIVGAAAVVVIAVEIARGRSPAASPGNYDVTSNGGYRPWPAIDWLVLHLAELDLAVFVLPFAALIVLLANARHLDRRLRVFIAGSTSLSVWLTLEVAVFASRYSQRIEERNLFYLMPLLVIALFAWLELWTHSFPRLASSAYAQGIGKPGKSWIDRAVGRNAHVGVVFAGGNQLAVLENEFWNRSIDRVYGLGARLPGDMPEIQTSVDPATGRLRGVTELYVLAPRTVQLIGTRVAADPAKELVLYRVTQP